VKPIQPADVNKPSAPVHPENVHLERKGLLRDLRKQLDSLLYGIRNRSGYIAMLGFADLVTRFLTGAPMRRYSQVSPNLFVSGQHNASGLKRLRKWGVTCVVNLRKEYDDQAAGVAPARYLHLPIVDNTPATLDQIRQGVEFIENEIVSGGKVFIHCAAGVGRAPSLAAAYLISEGMKPEDAWKQIRKARPFIQPTPAQIAQVEAYAKYLRERPDAEAVQAAASAVAVPAALAPPAAPQMPTPAQAEGSAESS
jgi:predicted protein tyrosine phosphatase